MSGELNQDPRRLLEAGNSPFTAENFASDRPCACNGASSGVQNVRASDLDSIRPRSIFNVEWFIRGSSPRHAYNSRRGVTPNRAQFLTDAWTFVQAKIPTARGRSREPGIIPCHRSLIHRSETQHARCIIKVESFNDPRVNALQPNEKPTPAMESLARPPWGKASLRGRRTNLKRLPRDTTAPEKKLLSLSLSLAGAAGFALKRTPTRAEERTKEVEGKRGKEKSGKGRTWYSRRNYASRISQPRASIKSGHISRVR